MESDSKEYKPETESEKQERYEALDRANRVSYLFRKEYFESIMKPVRAYYIVKEKAMKELQGEALHQHLADREKPFFDEFSRACKAAAMEDKAIPWMWNYLRNYKETLYWACPSDGW